MTTKWSNIAAKNCPKIVPKGPNPDLTLPKNNTKNFEEKIDFWNNPKYDCGWKNVEAQIAESYRKAKQVVPIEVYGRPGLLDKYK